MELKPGYKMTEVGVIPEDWECCSIADLFSISVGGDLRKNEFCSAVNSQHKFPIYANSLSNNGLYGFSSTFDFPGNNITITARGDIGHATSRLNPFCAIGRLLVLIPKKELLCQFFSDYINCFVSFPNENTGVPQLTAPQVEKHFVAVPSYDEQTAIATVLSDVDALLSSLDALIAKKRDMKQAAMQELLTGRRRLQGFSGEWHLILIGDSKYSDIDKDYLPSNTDPNYIFSYITLENVENGKLLNTIICNYKMSPSRARKIPHCNDILFGTVRPNLHSHLFFDKFLTINNPICSTGFCVISCKQEYLIPKFLYYKFFSSEIDIQINQIITGSNYPAISSSDVRTLNISIPPTTAEQTAIAAVLSDMDAEIAALEARRAKTQALKQGMMQELLTGRIRLRPTEGESHA